MLPRAALLAAGIACAASACAPRAAVRAPLQRPPRALPPGARAEFSPGAFEGVFAQAVRTVRERGYGIIACDAGLGLLATSRVELEARCGDTSCLARESTAVKLGHRRARVTLTREVWDPAVRAWRVPDDAAAVASIARDELDLLEAIVSGGGAPERAHPDGAPDPCAAAACDDGTCLAASADPIR